MFHERHIELFQPLDVDLFVRSYNNSKKICKFFFLLTLYMWRNFWRRNVDDNDNI